MGKKNRPGADARGNTGEGQVPKKEAAPVHHGKGQLMDGLAAWESEAPGAGRQIMRVVRLDDNEQMFIPFTTSMTRVNLHYLDSQDMREFVHCPGETCLLCKVGRAVEMRDLFPVYDIVDRNVGVLPISPNVRANALRPQWQPVLERLRVDKEPFLVTIRKSGMAQFVVGTSPLPKGSDDGANVIAQFRAKMDAGEVDLAAVYQRLDSFVIQDIPEIARLMTAKGIARCSSDPFPM
jgi:hypothetical protein